MHVISRSRLVDFWMGHADAEAPLRTWYRIARLADWWHWGDLARSFPSADLVGKLVVFNVGGNRFRLIAYVDYAHKKVFVRSVLTHAQYSKESWKTDPVVLTGNTAPCAGHFRRVPSLRNASCHRPS